VVVRCGYTESAPRSPWSMLGFIGKIYDEGSPLRLALAFEQTTDWHKKTPTLIA
jgi:Asp-tRNA(Asn)/Glu-tRNA(Gln) amidotransferase A subunit family amidase